MTSTVLSPEELADELRKLSLPELEARSRNVRHALWGLGMHHRLYNALLAEQRAINEERLRRLNPEASR